MTSFSGSRASAASVSVDRRFVLSWFAGPSTHLDNASSVMVDPELEAFTRRIHLVAYAAQAGYEPSARERLAGFAFLEHPKTGDAIAIARTEGGAWIYASLAECAPRRAKESAEETRERLREGITRTADKGTILEFEQRRERMEGRGELSREALCARLRAWAGVEREAAEPRSRGRARPLDGGPEAAAGGRPPDRSGVDAKLALNQHRYDWSPAPFGVEQTQLQDRLRRWDEAQRHVERALGRSQPSLEHAPGGFSHPKRSGPERGR
jgi:hypothetical protein